MMASLPSGSPPLSPRRRILELEAELRALAGMLANRSPAHAPELVVANQALELRLAKLETSIFTLMTENLLKPRQTDEALQQAEVLRQAAVEYCQLSKIDLELWKNIAF